LFSPAIPCKYINKYYSRLFKNILDFMKISPIQKIGRTKGFIAFTVTVSLVDGFVFSEHLQNSPQSGRLSRNPLDSAVGE
jgi:hypothetical protein